MCLGAFTLHRYYVLLLFFCFVFAKNMLAFVAMCHDFLCHAETACAFPLTSSIGIANCFIKCHLFSKCSKIKAEEDESCMRAEIKKLFILQMSPIGIFFL